MQRLALWAVVICVAACGGATESERVFDRSAAAERIALRLKQHAAWEERMRPLGEQQVRGEKIDIELLKRESRREPSFTDLCEDALAVIGANEEDEAAFRAMQVLLPTTRLTADNQERWAQSPDGQIHERIATVLMERHIGRPQFLEAAQLLSFASVSEAARYWVQVYQRSTHRSVRAVALSLAIAFQQESLGDYDLSASQRILLRDKIVRGAKEIERSYADFSESVQSARATVQTLQFLPGVILPTVAFPTLDGQVDSLAHYRGKVVLIDVWATWCGWCRAAHPKLAQLQDELQRQPFEIIAISVDEDARTVSDFVRKHDVPGTQWHAGPNQQELLKRWGIAGYPAYLLIDEQGTMDARTSRLTDPFLSHVRQVVARAQG